MEFDSGVIGFKLSGDQRKAARFTAEGRNLALSLRNRNGLGEAESSSVTAEFDDGAVICKAVSYMGTMAVYIHAKTKEEVLKHEIAYLDYIPDFVSGVIEGGQISNSKMLELYPTTPTRKKYEYPETGWVATDRLAVAPWNPEQTRVQPFKYDSEVRSSIDSGFTWWVAPTVGQSAPQQSTYGLDLGSDFMLKVLQSAGRMKSPSQYAKIKPTFYSGTMRKVVQILGGFGRYPSKPTYRLSVFDKYDRTYLSAYEKQVLREGRQIRYDYKFERTHGITKASDGKMWLVEISRSQGVWAMPLKLHPKSTTKQFKEYLEKINDTEALAVIELLGGFPTGEAIPPINRQAGIDAGMLLQLAKPSALTEFYQNQPYSTAMGWAFNGSGTEADNTCYEYDDTLRMVGFHYNISINIGKSRDIEPPGAKLALFERLTSEMLSSASEMDILAYKIDMMTNREAEKVFKSEDFLKTLRELKVTPLATGSANMALVSKGYLWTHPGKKPISTLKFWEPTISSGAVVSHMMMPLMGFTGGMPECDTTVLVFYAGEKRITCNFFATSKTGGDSSTSNIPPCPVGGFSSSSRSGGGKLMGHYYTSVHDTRVEAHPNNSETTGRYTPMGVVAVGLSDDPTDIRYGIITRSKGFRFSSKTTSSEGYNLQNALVWPAWNREAYYYSTFECSISGSESTSSGAITLPDPFWAEYYRTLNVAEGSGGYYGMPHPKCGDKQTARRVLRLHGEGNGECASAAGSSQWLSMCQSVDGMATATPLPPTVTTSTNRGYEAKVNTVFYCSEFGERECQKDEPVPVNWRSMWMENSPLPSGELQFIAATNNCMGDTEAIRYDTDLNPTMDEIKIEGFQVKEDRLKQNISFVGVV